MIVEVYFVSCLALQEMEPVCVTEYGGEFNQNEPLVDPGKCFIEGIKHAYNIPKTHWTIVDFGCKVRPSWRIYS